MGRNPYNPMPEALRHAEERARLECRRVLVYASTRSDTVYVRTEDEPKPARAVLFQSFDCKGKVENSGGK